ncbi:TonB system biopolymer transport component [Vibrio maritimus]|uniref:TonB system biopolymer transport component n=1 Tax=Vibrio maritimus TaxID=990268 RepID=A0A090SY87_9VIBR|nr:TonB system biopolymer transport component [Vibrio maritimus]
MNKTALRLTLCSLPLLSLSSFANANDLNTARNVEAKTITQSAQSQARINKSSDKAFELKSEIAMLEQEVANLEVYERHLKDVVNNQEQEMASIDVQLEQISDTRQGVVPLMYQMLEGLEQHIASDKPIRQQTRLARLDELKALMPQADVSDAEKYRRILEAYQIEMDYGIKLGSYRSLINVGSEIEAEQLYLGRLSLVARSLDRNQYWTWDSLQNNWVAVDAALAPQIDKAFAIANKQASPALIELPVSLQKDPS